MELNINSPVYYKNHYGIDNAVYRFTQRAQLFFKEKKYSNTLQIIGIVPIIAPQEVYAAGNYKERVKFLCGKSVASVEIRVDFDAYHNAGSSGKIALTKDMLLTAAKRIKTKVDFDYDRFKDDLESLQ
ncbi:MAG: hypothetical protein ACLUF9_08220 [Oscillospiraceae bacterium]